MKCATCGATLRTTGWIITRIGQARAVTSSYCDWCMRGHVGAVPAKRLEGAVFVSGWVQDPLPEPLRAD